MRAGRLLFILLLAAEVTAADLAFTGFARALDSGELLYVETHAVQAPGTPHERRVVLYRCARDSAPFARKLLDFSGSRTRPQFEFDDARSGFAEALGVNGDTLLVTRRRGAREAAETRTLAPIDRLVADAGFDELVRGAWNELRSGRSLVVPFLVPSRLAAMDFRVRKSRSVDIGGERATAFRLSLAGAVGWLLPDIEVTYRDADRRLLRYRGLTNIRDARGELLEAEIEFPDAARSTGPVDLAALLAMPLSADCSS